MVDSKNGLRIVSSPPGTGYGDAAVQYAVGLHRLGASVRWSPVDWESTEPLDPKTVLYRVPAEAQESITRVLEDPIDYGAFLLEVPPPSMHGRWLLSQSGKRAFSYVAWETDQLPDDWVPALAPYERIFVPSEFNRDLLVRSGLSAVDVVPHAARSVDATPAGERPSWMGADRDDFVFYTIGTWYTRKAMEETIRAYLEAFSADDAVVLVVKTTWLDSIALAATPREERSATDPRVSTAWRLAHILRDYPAPARVHLIVESLSARKVDSLHAHGDCFVSLSRSEGFGLCPFDALLFGNPAVVTSWGGPVEYLATDYPLAVRYDLEPTLLAPEDDQHMRSHEALWARADRAHASALMRRVFEDQAAARSIGLQMQSRLRRQYAPERICARLAELMEL